MTSSREGAPDRRVAEAAPGVAFLKGADGAQLSRRGAAIWDFLTGFVAARRTFLSIFRRYERRVMRAARERRVGRTDLVLPPAELAELFHLEMLEHLRDRRLGPLRNMASEIFGASGDEGLMDAYVGHIYHEISILSEEHRSVGRFVKHHDPRRYRDLFREVSGYYPTRLRRVKRLFGYAMKRLDELLPRWSQRRIVVRSAWLFGEPLARRAWGRGQDALYERMYPAGGKIMGFCEAARSFHESGFLPEAQEALGRALKVSEELTATRELMSDERKALDHVQELMAEIVGAGSGGAP